MSTLLLTFGLVFVAELGDKSQLMAMTFSTRYRARDVILGAGLAAAVMNLASALVGSFIGAALPNDLVRILAALLFVVFAGLALLELRRADDDATSPREHGGWAVLVVGLAFSLAELGDKTMLATAGLSTQYPWPFVWAGATLGMLASIVLAVLVGRTLLRFLPRRTLHLISAALFAAVGLWLLLG